MAGGAAVRTRLPLAADASEARRVAAQAAVGLLRRWLVQQRGGQGAQQCGREAVAGAGGRPVDGMGGARTRLG
eukprot:6376540-Prymnesium_polylepis.1